MSHQSDLDDLAGLLREAGFHHRPSMDEYLVRTISIVICRLCQEARS